MHPIESQRQVLTDAVLMMASIARRNLALAIRATVDRDSSTAAAVRAEDDDLDRMEIVIDDAVTVFIVRNRPVAGDLRFALAASAVGRHLQSIGNEAVAVAEFAAQLARKPFPEDAAIAIPRMAAVALDMLERSADAFVTLRPHDMREVVERDRDVDSQCRALTALCHSRMLENPQNVPAQILIIMIARCVERAADHCKNIAEEVVFLAEGVNIRHGLRNASRNGGY